MKISQRHNMGQRPAAMPAFNSERQPRRAWQTLQCGKVARDVV